MISFWISVVPPRIDRTRLSSQSSQWCRRAVDLLPPVKAGSIGSARAATYARCDLGSDNPPGDRLAAPQLPSRGAVLTTTPNQRPRISPAVGTDIESGELIAAQLPQVLVMHDARDGSQMGPSRGNQNLHRGQDAHHNSMGTYGAR